MRTVPVIELHSCNLFILGDRAVALLFDYSKVPLLDLDDSAHGPCP